MAQERKYAARVGLRLCRAMRARLQAFTYYYAIFNYCVGTSGIPASVLNIVGDQPLYTDPMPLTTSKLKIFNKNYKGLGTTEKEKKQEETQTGR